ncbi:MAG: OmpW family outer membrane protein [Gammaproteobacteria bacterium]
MSSRNHLTGSKAAAVVLTGATLLAMSSATHAGEWLLRGGVHAVDPKSGNHAVVSVDSAESLSFGVTYLYNERWGVEVLGALPFSHDIHLRADNSKVAKTRHLPPTVSVQYHLAPRAKIRPYIGVGVNGTIFFDEKTRGALADEKLSLDSSFGFAGQLGADFMLNDSWFINIDARWIDIDTRAKLSGASIGTVAIDPLVLGVSVGWRFGGH